MKAAIAARLRYIAWLLDPPEYTPAELEAIIERLEWELTWRCSRPDHPPLGPGVRHGLDAPEVLGPPEQDSRTL